MSPASYLAAPPRDITLFNRRSISPVKQLNYNTKNKKICQLFFRVFLKKIKNFSKNFFCAYFSTYYIHPRVRKRAFVEKIFIRQTKHFTSYAFYDIIEKIKRRNAFRQKGRAYEDFAKLERLYHYRHGRRI